MKKILSLVTVVAIMLSLAACGGKKVIPEGFTEETYEQASKALKLMDQYLSSKITPAKLSEKMGSIYEALTAEADKLQSVLDNDPSDKDAILLSMDTGLLLTSISGFVLGAIDENNDKCLQCRDYVYGKLNPVNK